MQTQVGCTVTPTSSDDLTKATAQHSHNLQVSAVESAEQHSSQDFDRANHADQEAVKTLLRVQRIVIPEAQKLLSTGSVQRLDPDCPDDTHSWLSVVFPSCENDHRHEDDMWVTSDTVQYYLHHVGNNWQQCVESLRGHLPAY